MRQSSIIFFVAISCVVLFSCAGANTQLDIGKSGVQYSSPRTSTGTIRGGNVAYQLWVDTNKWEIYGSDDAGFIDFQNMQRGRDTGLSHVLKHRSGECMAITQEIPKPADFGKLHKTLTESLAMRKGAVISEEIRTVNGSEMLYIKWIEDLGASKIVWMSYYLLNETGHMRLAVGTTEQLLATYESDMIDLLNGLANSDLRGSPAIVAEDDIESKLTQLQKLLKNGLITQKDYDKKKTELLRDF